MTRLYIIPVDHPNLYTDYYRQEEFCKRMLGTLCKEGDAILVEDDASKFSNEGKIRGWYDPRVCRQEQELLKVRDAIERLQFNPFHPSPKDEQIVNDFLANVHLPEFLEGCSPLEAAAHCIALRIFKSVEDTWAERQEFLRSQILILCEEGIENIYLKGGRDHFDPAYLDSLKIPYEFYDVSPAPSATHEMTPALIQQIS